MLVKRLHFVVAASLTMSVLYALSGALVVLCVLLSRACGTTLAVVCYALRFPLVHVVIWLLTYVTVTGYLVVGDTQTLTNPDPLLLLRSILRLGWV